LGTGFLVRAREAAARPEVFFLAALEAVGALFLLEPFRFVERFLAAGRFANVIPPGPGWATRNRRRMLSQARALPPTGERLETMRMSFRSAG